MRRRYLICLFAISAMINFLSIHAATGSDSSATISFTDAVQDMNKGLCEQIFTESHTFITGGPLAVGLFNELPHLLREAGTSTQGTQILLHFLNQMVSIDSKNIYFNEIANSLQADPRGLALCVGGETCNLNAQQLPNPPSPLGQEAISGHSGHVLYFNENFRPETLAKGNETLSQSKAQEVQKNWREISGFGWNDIIYLRTFDFKTAQIGFDGNRLALTLNIPTIIELAFWYGQFLRDVSKHVTTSLFDNWIRANVEIVANGGKSDWLFNKFVRIGNDGSVQIDINFFRTMLHARAARVWFSVETHFYYSTDIKNHPRLNDFVRASHDGHISGTLKDLTGEIGADNLAKLGVTKDTIFPLSAQWTEEMQKTMVRAKSGLN